MFKQALVRCICGVGMMTDDSYLSQKYMTCPRCNNHVSLETMKLGHRDSDCFTLVKSRRLVNIDQGLIRGRIFA